MKDLNQYLKDITTHTGEGYREFLQEYHPEFDNIPETLIPWPYRPSDISDPTHCPRCGRLVVHYWWGERGYHEVACAGPLSLVFVLLRRPGWLFWLHHWQIAVGVDAQKATRIDYDPESGQPMDGPPR